MVAPKHIGEDADFFLNLDNNLSATTHIKY